MSRPGRMIRGYLLVCLVASISLSSGATSQTKKDLVGTWTIVSAITTGPDGKVQYEYGGAPGDSKPLGTLKFDNAGQYSLILRKPGLLPFKGSRTEGSDEENRAVVHGSIANFGRYCVMWANGGSDCPADIFDKTNFSSTLDPNCPCLIFSIEAATFPNWDGVIQKRPIELLSDELIYRVPQSSSGGTFKARWKRVD